QGRSTLPRTSPTDWFCGGMVPARYGQDRSSVFLLTVFVMIRENMMRTITRTLMAAALGATLLAPPASAQESGAQTAELSGFWLTTSWPEMTIKPGENHSVSLSLRNQNLPPQ